MYALEKRVALLEETSRQRSDLLLTVMTNIERFSSGEAFKQFQEEFRAINARLDALEYP